MDNLPLLMLKKSEKASNSNLLLGLISSPYDGCISCYLVMWTLSLTASVSALTS